MIVGTERERKKEHKNSYGQRKKKAAIPLTLKQTNTV